MPHMPEPDYLARTRDAWTKMSVGFFEPGRCAWASPEITWGIWHLPESEVQALGDLSWFPGKATIELGCGTAYVSAWLTRLGARVSAANVAFDDHPSAKRYSDRIETVTVDSVFDWLERSGLSAPMQVLH